MLDTGIAWGKYYAIPLTMAGVSLPLVWLAFRGYDQPHEEDATESAWGRVLLAIKKPVVFTAGILTALVSSLCAS